MRARTDTHAIASNNIHDNKQHATVLFICVYLNNEQFYSREDGKDRAERWILEQLLLVHLPHML